MAATYTQPPFVASAIPPVPVDVVNGTQFGINASTQQGMNQLQVGLGPVQSYYAVGIQGGNLQTAYATGINYGIGSQQHGTATYIGQSGYGHSGMQSASIFGLHDTKTQAESIDSSGLGIGATRNIGIGGTSIFESASGFKAGPQGMSMDADISIGGKKCIDFNCTNCSCCCSCTELCSGLKKVGSAAECIWDCLGGCLKCVVELVDKPGSRR